MKQVIHSVIDCARLAIGLALFLVGFIIAAIGVIEYSMPEIIGGFACVILGIIIVTPKQLYKEIIGAIISGLPFP